MPVGLDLINFSDFLEYCIFVKDVIISKGFHSSLKQYLVRFDCCAQWQRFDFWVTMTKTVKGIIKGLAFIGNIVFHKARLVCWSSSIS